MSKRRKRNRGSADNELVRTTPFRVSRDTAEVPFANPRCYARCLNSCSRKISGEHYFTYALLRKITSDPRGIHLKGAPWQPDGVWLQPETATASILCERHNGQLATLDAFASALDEELSRIHEGAPLGQGVSTVARFHGPNLERWLMKTLCGFATARSGVFAPGQSMFVVPEEWVRFLFAETDLSAPAGVYLSAAVGESFAMDPKGFTFTSLHAQGLLSGLMVDMKNVRFMFISIPWEGTIGGVLNEASVRRPWKITFRTREVESQVEFEWPGECGPEVRYGYVFTGGAAANS